jgi:hypothetical protein
MYLHGHKLAAWHPQIESRTSNLRNIGNWRRICLGLDEKSAESIYFIDSEFIQRIREFRIHITSATKRDKRLERLESRDQYASTNRSPLCTIKALRKTFSSSRPWYSNTKWAAAGRASIWSRRTSNITLQDRPPEGSTLSRPPSIPNSSEEAYREAKATNVMGLQPQAECGTGDKILRR